PLFVSKSALSSGPSAPVSQSTCALASVACPQSATSTAGVNQRRRKPSPSGCRNAVSLRFISPATRCIHASSRGPDNTHTAAGLPPNGFAVKASTTWTVRFTRFRASLPRKQKRAKCEDEARSQQEVKTLLDLLA